MLSLSVFFKGLGIGSGLIVAIGAQNAFVLKQGLKQQYVF
ncbi:amino acid transporter, partial [Acinetobacter junii]